MRSNVRSAVRGPAAWGFEGAERENAPKALGASACGRCIWKVARDDARAQKVLYPCAFNAAAIINNVSCQRVL